MRMKLLRTVCLLLAAVLATGCGSGTKEFRLAATTDVHGHLFPYSYEQGVEAPAGSLAKVETWLTGQRRQYKDRLIYLDCGDILEGTALSYQDKTADYSGYSIAVQVLDEMGCAVSSFGNHDFMVGPSCFNRFLDTSRHPVVCANLFYKDTEETCLPPYVIVERKGVKFAIVGLVTPKVNIQQTPSELSMFTVIDAVESAKVLIPYIKETDAPDVIIGLLHTGFEGGWELDGWEENESRRIATEVPGFDAVFYGHDHIANLTKVANCQGDSVILINPGPYAEQVAVIDASIVKKRGNVVSKSFTASIENVTGLEPDGRFVINHKDKIDAVCNYMDSVLGTFSAPACAYDAAWAPCSGVGYIAQAMKKATQADIALASAFSNDWCIEAGNVTPADLMRAYVYDNNTISTVLLSGAEVHRLLESVSARCMNTIHSEADTLLKLNRTSEGFELAYTAYDFFSALGIEYTVNVTKPAGSRVVITGFTDGRKFDEKAIYRVAVNSYLAGGAYDPFTEGLGLSIEELRSREDLSTMADVRFHLITALDVARGEGLGVEPLMPVNWRLIPEDMVSVALARDTKLAGFN